MFRKQSRYYKLNASVAPNKDGVMVEGKQLRDLPEVEGKVFYRLESGDRLDHLAYKFYQRPKQWWHICDANPEFLSPRDLLGQSPEKQLGIDLSWLGYQPDWYGLAQKLKRLPGVRDVLRGNAAQPLAIKDITYSVTDTLADLAVGLQTEFDQALLLQTISAPLNAAFAAAGITLGSQIKATQPAEGQWDVDDSENQQLLRCVLIDVPNVIRVYTTTIQYSWHYQVGYNQNIIDQQTLLDQITSTGFEIEQHALVGRVGKKIHVPPKYIG